MLTRRVFVGRTAAAAAALAWRMPAPTASVVIRGGTVYDGTGAPPIRADVAIDGDRIRAVGTNLQTTGSTIIDARGKSSAASAANAVVNHLQSMTRATPPGITCWLTAR